MDQAADHQHEQHQIRQHSHHDPSQQQHAAMHGDGMQMHAMAFHFGVNETILFGFWRTSSAFGILASCFLIVLACFGLELARWYRLHRKRLRQYSQQQQQYSSTGQSNSSIQLAGGGSNEGQPAGGGEQIRARLRATCPDAMLFAVQLTLGYLLMLVFMTFNVWLCAAIVVGEVGARLALAVCFPQLDFVGAILNSAGAEPSCCG